MAMKIFEWCKFWKRKKVKDNPDDENETENPFKYDDNGEYLYPNYPVEWSQLLPFLQKHEGITCRVYIPVNENAFGDLGKFAGQIPTLVEGSYLSGIATLKDNAIKVLYCIEEADRGDEYGYGIKPDKWIVGKMDLDGNYIEKFDLVK